MATQKKLLDTFEVVGQLGRGGMGAVYEVIADPSTPQFAQFLADMIAWREATNPEMFSEFIKPIQMMRSDLEKNIAQEIELQDLSAEIQSIEKTRLETSQLKIALKKGIENLKKEQLQYVRERVAKLIGQMPGQLMPLLKNYDVVLPSDLRFALKIALGQKGGEDLRRLQDEWKSLITLVHPNIVNVYSGGNNYYIMEFIKDKISPRQILENFNISQKVQVIHDAAKGLAYAHSQGVIHRDIKPDNLFTYRSKNRVHTKVGDFGLAKTDMGMTVTGSVAGTFYFMSPEQVQNAKKCTELSDIYSLGATLYCYITGIPPFEKAGEDAPSLYEIQKRIIEEPVIPPSKLIPGMPSDLEDIILAMMEKHPSQRPQSLNEVELLLEDYISRHGKASSSILTPENVTIRQERRIHVRHRKKASLIPSPGETGYKDSENSAELTLERAKSESQIIILDQKRRVSDIKPNIQARTVQKPTAPKPSKLTVSSTVVRVEKIEKGATNPKFEKEETPAETSPPKEQALKNEKTPQKKKSHPFLIFLCIIFILCTFYFLSIGPAAVSKLNPSLTRLLFKPIIILHNDKILQEKVPWIRDGINGYIELWGIRWEDKFNKDALK